MAQAEHLTADTTAPTVAPTPTPTPAAAPTAHAAASALAPAAPPSRRPVQWGVYVPQFPGDISAVDAVDRAAGQHTDMVMWYVHWGGSWSGFNAGDVRAVISRGSTPLITWMSDDPSASGYPDPASQRDYTAASILSGRFDSYIRTWAAGLRDAGGTVLLRLDHEMNGNWYAWSPGVNGQTAQDYVAAWRHVHDIFTATGATNVQWVWNPNVAYAGSAPLAALYPGDAYVDRVGVDGYNWGSTSREHTWQSFADVFDATLAQVAAITSRPVLIGEVASAEAGGDKGAWIRDFFTELAQRPGIDGFVWFDADKEADWRVDSSPVARAAFAAGLASVR